MTGHVIFAISFIVATYLGFTYFRDLGDVTQMILKVKREDTVRFIRHEYQILAIGLGAIVLMSVSYLFLEGGVGWLFWAALVVLLFLYGFPWIWVHLGLRNQRNSAIYYNIEEAREALSPASPILVIEKNGIARAHPDSHLLRPHLAGNSEGLDGKT